MATMNHYDHLSLDSDADEATIRQAITWQSATWSKRASSASALDKRHEAERQLRLIQEARQVLLDPDRRRAYDATLLTAPALPGPHRKQRASRSDVASDAVAPPARDHRFGLGLMTGGLCVGLATWWLATSRPAVDQPAAAVRSAAPAVVAVAERIAESEPHAEVAAHPEQAMPLPIDLTSRATPTASSIKNEGGLRHLPGRAIDGAMGTAWEEGAPGPGVGEWIELRFDRPYHITRVGFVPGYAKYVADAYGDRFMKNARVKVATILWDTGEMDAFPADRPAMCYVELPGAETSSVRLRVDEVRRGVWDDLCISEITVWGYE
jgi:hypothetical protein